MEETTTSIPLSPDAAPRSTLKPGNHWGVVTTILGGILLILSLCYTAKMGEAMATTSLLNDEFYSTSHFTTKGPLYVLTNYPAANNHVFFNLLRSVSPGSDSYLPLRARWISFVSVFGFFAVIIGYFASRGLLFEGVLASLPFLLSERFLDQALQSRGFGLVFFLTAAVVVALVEFVRTRRQFWLTILAGGIFFSAWTMPPAVLLGGLMMICLVPFAWKRVIVTGAIAGTLIALVYAPILADIYKESSTYTYGEYDTLIAPMRTLALYWFSKGFADTQLASSLLAGLVVVTPILIGIGRWPRHRAELILTCVSVALFAIFLAMKTPIHRAACYALIPPAMSFALAVGKWWSDPSRRALSVTRCLAALATLCVMIPLILNAVSTFRYIPPEDHLTPATFINQQFPPTLEIASPVAVAAAMHLVKNPSRFVYEIDKEKVANSEQIILDNRRRIQPDTPRIAPEEISPNAISIDFPELSTGFQRILFVPSDRENLTAFSLQQKEGTTSGRTWELQVEASKKARFLNFHSPMLSLSKPATYRIMEGDSLKKLDPAVTFRDRLGTIDLEASGIAPGASILIYFTSTETVEKIDDLQLQVWAQ